MDYAAEAENLVKSYHGFRALDGLSIHVPKGAIYGLVGKNGAGKTTLLRVLTGLQHPSGGSFSIYGSRPGSPEMISARRRIGAMLDSPAVYRDLSALDNLKAQFLLLGLPSFSGTEELLRLAGLESAGKRKVKSFSLGMRQRLGIAMALAGDPDFLILDEPVNGLDPQGIVEVRELLLRLNRERMVTVLLSSHMLDELSRIATHYGVIHQGRMVKEFSAKELETLCRKCVRIRVSDAAGLSCLLDSMGLEYQVLPENTVDVFARVNVTELTLALAKAGCEVYSMQERDENLEGYFFSLVGGDKT